MAEKKYRWVAVDYVLDTLIASEVPMTCYDIARVTGYNQRTCQRAVKSLVAYGIINVEIFTKKNYSGDCYMYHVPDSEIGNASKVLCEGVQNVIR